MRALIIGTGSIGQRHMASLRQLVPGVAFDVLREDGRSRDVSALGANVGVCTSLHEALGKRPNLMVIANPSSMHLRYLNAALDAGLPFYAEKPVVTDVAELSDLQRRVRHAPQPLPPNLVGCNLRFLPSLRHLRDLVQAGSLGRLVRASFEAGQWLPDWRPSRDYRQGYSARRQLGGGVMLDLIHETDAARWLLGDFTDVLAQAWHGSSLEIDTEDAAGMLLRAERGPVVSVQLDYVSRRPFRRYRLIGDQATAEWDLPSRRLTLARAERVEDLPLPEGAFDVAATYVEAMRELLEAMAQGRATEQPIQEGLAAVELVLRARAQARH